MKLSAWERIAFVFAPEWATRRAALREGLRNYDAAAPGYRTAGWPKRSGDANQAAAGAQPILRMHARDLVRNNSWAKRAVRIVAQNTVGWGISPRPLSKASKVNEKANELWAEWAGTTACDSEGRLTFAGIQAQVVRAIASDGEAFIRFRARRPEDGLPIPLQLQVLESDFLDSGRNGITSEAGGPLVQGVEFDKLGRRAAYWLYPQHPGSGRNASASVRIPAVEVAHIFFPERPGQTRGVSWMASAIVNMKDLDEYEDAELMKQKIAACFAAFVVDLEGTTPPVGGVAPAGAAVDPLADNIEPGMILNLPQGRTVSFGNPPTVTADSYAYRQLRRISAGLNLPFEQLVGDYSQVNFSAAKMSQIAHYQSVHDWQFNMVIPQLCQPVWAAAMGAAYAAGSIPEIPRSDWTTPPMPMLEPDKEGLAIQRLVRNGVKTLSEVIREQGGDPASHFAAIAADMETWDKLGIKLDCDVRAVSQAGLTQQRAGLNSGGPPEGEEQAS